MSLKKETKDIRRWKGLQNLWIGRFNTVNMTILSKAIFRLNSILIKTSKQCFTDPERTIFTFIFSNIKPRIRKIILYNRISGGITIPDCKLFFRAIVIKKNCQIMVAHIFNSNTWDSGAGGFL